MWRMPRTIIPRLELVTRYRDGTTIEALAEHFGVGSATVWRHLRAAEEPIRRRGGSRKPLSVSLPTDPGALGYIAGMIDGEGTIYQRGRDNGGFSARVSIYSTTEAVIEWLHQWGGHVRWDHTRVVKHGWKPMGSWEVSRAADVAAVIRATLPYLIIKRDLATEALALLEREPLP